VLPVEERRHGEMEKQDDRQRDEPEASAADFPDVGVARRGPDGAQMRERDGLLRRMHGG
jgi:hypothetical protein